LRRREFLLACAVVPVSSPALGTQPSLRRIGYVSWFSPAVSGQVEQFRKGMRDLGYIEGRDFTLDAHFTDGDRERTREVVRKLVQEKAEILVAVATPAIAMAKQEGGSLPIVMASVADPIASGFAQSLSRPGGNLTGRMMFGPELAGKRIDLVREIRPELRTIALLSSSLAAPSIRLVRETQAEADRSNLRLVARVVPGANAINLALFEAIRSEGVEAVIVAAIFSTYEAAIMKVANEVALPVIADYVEFAKAGAVLTYGIDLDANVRRAAYFVDRIFRGATPADLPIEQPTETKLAINLTAAKRFGWTISPSVLARADQVFE
jgi:ABC-type uncharacterized transport system substrate-binding protein